VSSRTLVIALAVLALAGCSGTTVVLVPDPDGKVGRVAVTTQGGETTLSSSGESTRAAAAEDKPEAPRIMSQEQIRERFGAALANEPMPPLRRQIHFATGSADLPAEATAVLQAVRQAIEIRKSCDISVIGHSDRAGDDRLNRELSLKRANTLAKALRELGVADSCLDVRYYGEHDPAVVTADGVAEPRNRRVELEIR